MRLKNISGYEDIYNIGDNGAKYRDKYLENNSLPHTRSL